MGRRRLPPLAAAAALALLLAAAAPPAAASRCKRVRKDLPAEELSFNHEPAPQLSLEELPRSFDWNNVNGHSMLVRCWLLSQEVWHCHPAAPAAPALLWHCAALLAAPASHQCPRLRPTCPHPQVPSWNQHIPQACAAPLPLF